MGRDGVGRDGVGRDGVGRDGVIEGRAHVDESLPVLSRRKTRSLRTFFSVCLALDFRGR